MSMTKTGIIGLVVLIVLLIGGYAIVTQNEEGGPLGENGTTTTETENGTTTDENADETDDMDENADNENMDENMDDDMSGNMDDMDESMNNENTQTENTNGNGMTGETGNQNTNRPGIGGSGDATPVTRVAVADYSNDELGVSFSYPETWDIEEDDSQVVTGQSFAGGMRSEMSVTVYEDTTIQEASDGALDVDNVTEGMQYQTELECKGDDLDCAGSTVYVAVDGEEDDGEWSGKIAKISFGVFEEAGYDGPDAGVSPDELLNVAASTFAGTVNSIQLQS